MLVMVACLHAEGRATLVLFPVLVGIDYSARGACAERLSPSSFYPASYGTGVTRRPRDQR